MEQEVRPSVRLLSFATGVIAGSLAAIAAQIYLARMNVELATAWHDLFVAWSAQFKSALAWWLVAGTALIAGYIAAALTRFLMLHWWPLRPLRWIAGAAIVAALAVIGRGGERNRGRRCRLPCRCEPARRGPRHDHRGDRRGVRRTELTAAQMRVGNARPHPHRTSSRIAWSRPARVSGYIRSANSWRIMRTDWV